MKRIQNNIKTTEIEKINESLLNCFLNNKVLIESDGKEFVGIFNKFKNNYALFNESNTVIKSFNLNNIDKLIGKNNKSNLLEKILHVKGGYKVVSEKGKNLGGPYKSQNEAKKRLKQVEYFKHIKEDKILQEKLKTLFFAEEIVNKDHKGRMTKSMQSSRDKIAGKLKNVKVVKGPPGRNDTPEEAKYRLATYIEWKKKQGEN